MHAVRPMTSKTRQPPPTRSQNAKRHSRLWRGGAIAVRAFGVPLLRHLIGPRVRFRRFIGITLVDRGLQATLPLNPGLGKEPTANLSHLAAPSHSHRRRH
jgi:hypothetical protein